MRLAEDGEGAAAWRVVVRVGGGEVTSPRELPVNNSGKERARGSERKKEGDCAMRNSCGPYSHC